MSHSLSVSSTQAAPQANHLGREREAWNPPRAPAGTVSRMSYRVGLDWDGFRDLYFPGSRRHDLKAIVAYGAYRSSQPANDAARLTGYATSTEAAALDDWVGEEGRDES